MEIGCAPTVAATHAKRRAVLVFVIAFTLHVWYQSGRAIVQRSIEVAASSVGAEARETAPQNATESPPFFDHELAQSA